jgi:hypothetical protein
MRRSLVVLVLTTSLLTPGASQTPWLGSLWGFLTSLWSKADAGAGWDPNGRNVTPAPQPSPDAGAGADPFG